MAFNAKEYVDAITPPTFVDLDGVTHTGKMLSFNQTLQLAQKFDELTKLLNSGEATPNDMTKAVKEICKALDIPADKVLQLPLGGVMKAVESFFASLLAM